MATRSPLPFACTAWLLSIFLVAPRADDGQPAAARASTPHLDLTLFTHSENCVACHNNLVTPAGDDVSIGSTWRSTMMANSARDPYWQAAVRRETLDHPQHSAAIQDECAACHMPMSQRITKAAGSTGEVFAQLPTTWRRRLRAAPTGRRRDLVYRLPSDGARSARHAGELQLQFRRASPSRRGARASSTDRTPSTPAARPSCGR